MAKKKVAKTATKKAVKKSAKKTAPKPFDLKKALAKAVKKFALPEEQVQSRTKGYRNGLKPGRLTAYVDRTAEQALLSLKEDYSEKLPLLSMENYAAAVEAVIEVSPWAQLGADFALASRPGVITKAAQNLLFPTPYSYGLDRTALPYEELGLETLRQAVEKLSELIDEVDHITKIHTDLPDDEEDEDRDEDEELLNSIERYDEEIGIWSEGLKAMQDLFNEESFGDLKSNLVDMHSAAVTLSFTLGERLGLVHVDFLAVLAPPKPIKWPEYTG